MTGVSIMKQDTCRINNAVCEINILFVCDFHQLDPPSGTPINVLPASFVCNARKYAPGATDEHGQYLFWSDGPGTVSGVTELTTCERHDKTDEWLLAVQDEFRRNELSSDTHAFLHGLPTKKPGSWLHGSATCGNAACASQAMEISKNNDSECEKCKQEINDENL